MKEENLETIKEECGETVLKCALINLFQIGKKPLGKFTLREQLSDLTNFFDSFEKSGGTFPITKDFATQILNCEIRLCAFDEMVLLTYFSKSEKKED